MKYENINKRYTEIVTEYITKGYYINTASQSGSQGEIAKIDVTDGKEIIRILIDDFHSCDNNIYLDGIEIIVGRVASTDGVAPNTARNYGTIWNNHLEVINAERFYQIGDEHKDGSRYYGTKDEAERAAIVKFERYKSKATSSKKEFPEAAKQLVLLFVKRQPKCKGVKLNEVESVYSVVNHSLFNNAESKAYYVKVRGKALRLK